MITFGALGAYGRFANGAFQLCSTVGIATKSGQPFGFKPWRNTDALERFGTTEDIDVYKHLVHPLPSIPEGMRFTEHGWGFGYHHIHLPTGNWDIKGHFQSEKYFAHCIDLVRYYLTFKEEKEDTPYTSIHCRFGDYSGNNASFHPRQTMDYYERAMAQIPGPYLVFSDEIDVAKEMFGNSVDYAEGNDYLTDFSLMKRCKNHIVANSSFSLLAAILANQEGKKVFCPSNWFGSGFGSGYREMSKDIYPAGSFVI
jgi:hypothetical protein